MSAYHADDQPDSWQHHVHGGLYPIPFQLASFKSTDSLSYSPQCETIPNDSITYRQENSESLRIAASPMSNYHECRNTMASSAC
jgi:hypothetical protein